MPNRWRDAAPGGLGILSACDSGNTKGGIVVDDVIVIRTPEHVEVRYAVAGIGTRFFALCCDMLLLGIVLALELLALLMVRRYIPATTPFALLTGAAIVLGFVLFTGYFILFEVLTNGQSPGKRLLHIRVIGLDGRPISFASAVIRNLLRIADWFPSTYLVGLIVMFCAGHSRRLGDLVAGTVVVRDSANATLQDLRARAAAADTALVADGPRMALDPALIGKHVPAELASLAEQLLARWPALPVEQQQRLVGEIAALWAAYLRWPPLPSSDALPFLQAGVAAWRLYAARR